MVLVIGKYASVCTRSFLDRMCKLFGGFKPWSNAVASRRKLKTSVYLRLRLARPCVHLRWLVMTCAHFGRDQICTQVKASCLPFGRPTQVSPSWETSINLLLANEIEHSLPKRGKEGNFGVRLATQRKSLRKFNLRPLATTCRSVWPGLNSALMWFERCLFIASISFEFIDKFYNYRWCIAWALSLFYFQGYLLIVIVIVLHAVIKHHQVQ